MAKIFWLKRLLPIEWLALFSLGVASLIASGDRIVFYSPDLNAVSFVIAHYLSPMLPALAIPLIIATVYRIRKQHTRIAKANAILLRRARQCLSITFIVFIHFNFKLWAQLLNTKLYDDLYHYWDLSLSSTVSSIEHLHLFLVTAFWLWPNAYHDVFVLMFIISFAIHAMHEQAWVFDRVVLAIALVLVIGGISYAIAPACGPFIYGPGVNPFATEVQMQMLDFQRGMVGSDGNSYRPEFFIAAVAAMPSLHIAHAFVLLWFAWRHVPVLGFAYLAPLAFLFSEAIAARWHYLADIPAGLAIAALCIAISHALEPANVDKNGGLPSIAH